MTASGACAIPDGHSVTSPVNLASSVSLRPPTYAPSSSPTLVQAAGVSPLGLGGGLFTDALVRMGWVTLQ